MNRIVGIHQKMHLRHKTRLSRHIVCQHSALTTFKNWPHGKNINKAAGGQNAICKKKNKILF